jgi:hypothetical protein
MRLEFVPVEEFYFALTLAVRTLEELAGDALVEQVKERLQDKFGQPSTVAAAKQNTFNYVFLVQDYDDGPAPQFPASQFPASQFPASQLVVSIADWQDKLRLSSDYGWTLDEERKPIRTERYDQRPEFSQALRAHLKDWLDLPLV